MNWIDANERLPEINKHILAWSTLDDEPVLAELLDDGNWYCQGLYGDNYYTREGTSHWQELPERPIVEMPKVLEIKTGELIGDRLE